MMILGRLLERTETISETVQDTSNRVQVIEQRLTDGHQRMSRIESKQKEKQKRQPHWLLLFLDEVASRKEWATGALLIILAVKGWVSPAEVKAFLLGAWPK